MTIRLLLPLILLGLGALVMSADDPPLVGQRQANGEVRLTFPAVANEHYRVDISDTLGGWQALSTLKNTTTTFDFTDTGAPYREKRFYRVVPLGTIAPTITGDHLPTSAGDAIFHPVNHGSFIFTWNGLTIYSDPVGATSVYTGLPKADLILVTHSHGDHFSRTTIDGVRNAANTNFRVLLPQNCYDTMTTTQKAYSTVMSTTASQTVQGVSVQSIPAYNANHTLGQCNSYVVTLGDKRVFISGDTGDVAEMKALQNIDVAFVCMNQPFTMTEAAAAGAVRAFRPKVVYPYHLRNQNGTFANTTLFKTTVGQDQGVEVRIRAWY